MKKFILASCIFLCGCVDPVTVDPSFTNPIPITYDNVVYVGDSNCDALYNYDYTAAELAGINHICKARRQLLQVTPNQLYGINQYDVVFLALGNNDASKHNPIESYRTRLLEFIAYDDANYVCVIPHRTDNIDVSEYRSVMNEECPNVIDPITYNVGLQSDGLHWTSEGHSVFSSVIVDYVESVL